MINTILNKIILPLLFCSVLCQAETTSQPPFLIHNAANVSELPKMFRMSISVIDKPLEGVSDVGLANLNTSASGQFSVQGLQAALAVIPSNHVLVIDLREESHGFINGEGISWYGYRNWDNRGKSLAEIEADEQAKLAFLLQRGLAQIQSKTSPEILFELPVAYIDIEKRQRV